MENVLNYMEEEERRSQNDRFYLLVYFFIFFFTKILSEPGATWRNVKEFGETPLEKTQWKVKGRQGL